MRMELCHILFSLLSLIPVAYLFLYKLMQKKESCTENRKLPPGTTGLPLIGENLDFYFKLQQGLQFKFVKDRMNKYASKIFKTSLIGQPTVMLCSAEGNKFLFSNENKLVQVWRPNSMDKILPMSDKKPVSMHSKKIRKLLSLIFKADVLKDYVSIMDAVMKQQLRTDWNDKQVKVSETSKKFLLTLACNIFLGINNPDKIEDLTIGADEIEFGIQSMPLNLPGTALNHGIEASKIMRAKLEAIIRKRKHDLSNGNSSSVKDFMSHLLLATDDNGQFFSEGDIATVLAGLILASYATARGTITMVMKYLAEFPNVYDSVLREQEEIAYSKGPEDSLSWEDLRKMKYTWDVACEVLRLFSLGTGGFREVITDITYEGYTIPKGWKILWLTHATHKNPEYFPDPEKFDPSRFEGNGPTPYAFVPFGGGSRMCPGYEYARIAILSFMHNVVIKFKWEKLIPNEKILYYPFPRPANGLPIRLYPRIS